MESTFLNKIAVSKLTRAQVSIADYIAKNQKRILNMTAQEIAHEIGVSDASVIRFSRAVGYEGFTDLREHSFCVFLNHLKSCIFRPDFWEVPSHFCLVHRR